MAAGWGAAVGSDRHRGADRHLPTGAGRPGGRRQRPDAAAPAAAAGRVVVYYVLAMCLFNQVGY
jgi:hypothetical protein